MTNKLTTVDPDAPGLLTVERARAWLARAVKVDDAKQIRDKAEAIAAYQRKQRAGKEAALDADTIVVLADRRIGELTRELPKVAGPGRGKRLPKTGNLSGKANALAAVGLTTQEASRCETAAAMPEREFQAAIDAERAKGKRITTRRIIEPARRVERDRELVAQAKPVSDGVRQCNVLLADPPWRYEHCEDEDGRSIERQYPTMDLDGICKLPVDSWCTADAVLFLWATSPKLAEAMVVMDAWGFRYRTCMVWIKDKIGMGYYARQRHELLLIGTRGKPAVPAASDRPDSVIEAPRQRHSQKPEQVYELIERMYPRLLKGELFARRERDGWSSWGNEL